MTLYSTPSVTSARMSPDPLRLLQNTVVQLLKHRPFYGHFLLQFRRRTMSTEQALAVTICDGTPTLFINPARYALFSDAERVAMLEHLVKHVLHLHPSRRKERQQWAWDLACDLAINPSIDNLPPEAPQPSKFKFPSGLAAEEYYQRLTLMPVLGKLKKAGHGNNQTMTDMGQKSTGQLTQASQQFQPVDDHSYWQEADRTPLALAEQVVRQMVQSAWKKCHQELEADLKNLLAQYLAPPKIPWQQILRQFIGTAGRVGATTTWTRPHRRFGQRTPGHRKQQYLNLLVAIDVSDSTDTQTLREAFACELMHITRARQSRITVLYCGSRIQKIESFTGSPQIIEVFRGGGYTDFRPAFDYASHQNPRPGAIIYLTDGYGTAPETCDIPTLWVLSPDGQKPATWGVELFLAPPDSPRNIRIIGQNRHNDGRQIDA